MDVLLFIRRRLAPTIVGSGFVVQIAIKNITRTKIILINLQKHIKKTQYLTNHMKNYRNTKVMMNLRR